MPLDLLEDDIASRRTALTSIGSCMLLRAGAGSGKTSVLAGRVISLLAAGTDPASIAAISFTVLSASELLERVTRFVDAVVADRVPPDLAPAFPDGVATAEQKERLLRARGSLDLLTCTTIHGFCAALLRPYPVEARFDPGAKPMDTAEADLLFGEVFDDWLRGRLESAAPDDLFLSLYIARPGAVHAELTALAKEMLARPDRAARACEAVGRVDGDLAAAVADFRAFVDARGEGNCPGRIVEVLRALERRVGEYPAAAHEAALVSWLMGLSAPDGCATADGGFNAASRVSTQAMWKEVLGGGRGMADQVKMAQSGAASLYEACKEAHGAMAHAAAPRILHVFCQEAHAMLAEYARRKCQAAVLDFDDLVQSTRALLRTRPDVRADLGRRFRHVLVDEFQDTDPSQVEILWRLCADPAEGAHDAHWTEWRLRPGSVFLVGDPKQAIYRFRGADLASYQQALKLLQETSGAEVLGISRNFRSRGGILEWVNRRFATVFGRPGQAERGDLITTVDDVLANPAVVALPLPVEPEKHTRAGEPVYGSRAVRDAEAEEVALLCARLIGHHQVRDRAAPGGVRLCQPRDIALLTPGGTDLWRYERALEERGITVAAQAGKGFFRRQEVQDLIALARVLADRQDTLALGALLRGPLVGATDEEMLDAVATQPAREDGTFPPLRLGMDLEEVSSPVLRVVLPFIETLARDRRSATPHALLSRAVELLRVRATLRQRGGRTAERALANVDLFLEQAKPFALRGLKAFAEHMARQWEDAEKAVDGRPDADLRSVTLMTMHGSKGLEWPVVIAVNQNTGLVDRGDVARDGDGYLHMKVLGLQSPDCAQAMEAEKEQRAFERERLWYVAATRARDLLVLPLLSGAKDSAWINVIPVHEEALPIHGADHEPMGMPPMESGENRQDVATFDAEARAIVAATPRIQRLTPHLAEVGETPASAMVLTEAGEPAVSTRVAGGGFRRGLCLHKLLEERLTGELGADTAAIERRSAELLEELGAGGEAEQDPAEIAGCVARALAAPPVAGILPRLRPEWPIAVSEVADGLESLTSGFADAVEVLEDGSIGTVVDWKSDIEPTECAVVQYRAQLLTYVRALGARCGLLVFATTGRVEEVS